MMGPPSYTVCVTLPRTAAASPICRTVQSVAKQGVARSNEPFAIQTLSLVLRLIAWCRSSAVLRSSFCTLR